MKLKIKKKCHYCNGIGTIEERPSQQKDIFEQAKRIAWRQIYRWLQSQLALINTEMVSIREIFLSFQLCKNQNTIFENIISNQTKMIDFKENQPNE
jgi:Fe-S cluster biosynthesis and repair protein YggX